MAYPLSARPLLLGHRGARISDPYIPENSFEAFDLALKEGCYGFEFDVRCTQDGRLLICHDSELMGRNVAGTAYSNFQDSAACLEDVLARYSGSAFLDIELKVAGMQNAVIAVLRANPPKRGYVVSSFLPEALFEINAQDGAIPLGFICDKKKELERWPTLPVEFVIPHHKLLSRHLIEELHGAGKKVFTLTVNDRNDMLRLAEWGAEAIISDQPRLLAQTFL